MPQNICLYFSDTGGGHRSAVDAIEAGIRQVIDSLPERADVSIIKENIAEKSHPINRGFVELYNYLLRHHQPLMKYYYWFIHLAKPNESPLGYLLCADYIRQLFKASQPSVVVSVHPMCNHFLARAMKEIGIKQKVKLVTVITDPNADLWRGWASEDADLIIAPNQLVKDKMIEWGMKPDRVAVAGMPVHPDFLRPASTGREQFLSALGLSPNMLTVCINAGWAGGGNMLKIYRALGQCKRPLQVIFLCGHNKQLYEEAMCAAAESDIATAVLPFHDCMPDLMSAVDLMVTKAGGLTTFQAIAKRLPMAIDLITEPMPQERGTADILIAQKLAYGVNQAEDILTIVEAFEPVENREQQPLPSAYSLDKTHAVFNMAALILAYCSQPIAVPQNQDSAPEERKPAASEVPDPASVMANPATTSEPNN